MATIKRQVFYSFEYKPDVFRVQQVINMGKVEGEPLLSSNAWEEVKKGIGGIKKWIDDNMLYRSCIIVLVGSNTSNREWVQYEIEKGWNDGKGVVGIHIHNLECAKTGYCNIGLNPFNQFILKDGEVKKNLFDPTKTFSFSDLYPIYLSDVIKCYDPPIYSVAQLFLDPKLTTGQVVYRHIRDNVESWVEEAISIRNKYKTKYYPWLPF